MNRRAFLTAFSSVATAATIDPERLLWEPRKTCYSIPSMIRPRVMGTGAVALQNLSYEGHIKFLATLKDEIAHNNLIYKSLIGSKSIVFEPRRTIRLPFDGASR
jgi:hypothetical protein